MSRKGSNLLDYGIEEEVDPKVKFDSLISVTVSTIMCLAAKCPLPKSNVETTKLFLRYFTPVYFSTITDDNGKTPRNIKGFLSLLKDYTGPYEDSLKENRFEKPPVEKLMREKEKKPSLENMVVPKCQTAHTMSREISSSPDGQALVKRTTKTTVKKNEKEQTKRGSKNLGSRITPSKSLISSKS